MYISTLTWVFFLHFSCCVVSDELSKWAILIDELSISAHLFYSPSLQGKHRITLGQEPNTVGYQQTYLGEG